MTAVVVDASLLIKLALPEPYTAEAVALIKDWISQNMTLIAPRLLAYEIVNVLYKRISRQQLTLSDAKQVLATLLSKGVMLNDEPALHGQALNLAQQLGRPATYDTHYLALAQREGCEFWTADERLWNAVKAQLPWVHWVGEHQP